MPDIKDSKSPFNMPQKTRLVVACALVALITVGAVATYIAYSIGRSASGADAPPGESGAVSSAPAESGDPAESEAQASQDLMGIVPTLTIDEARELALADAGTAEGGAEVSREALSEDNGVWVYEFHFRTEEAQYEYKINANTGEVRSMVKAIFVYPSEEPSMPALESAPPAGSSPVPQAPAVAQPSAAPQPAQSAAPAPAADVGVEQAKTAALKDAGVSAAQATFTKAERDYEDGILIYDVEFFTTTHEYGYEIVAATGAVYSRDVEAFQTAGTQANPDSAYIGIKQAKAAALGHAGLTAAQVTFTRAGMDRDDGKMVYEIEFRQGRTEYEYKIDAATGRILDHEMDAH